MYSGNRLEISLNGKIMLRFHECQCQDSAYFVSFGPTVACTPTWYLYFEPTSHIGLIDLFSISQERFEDLLNVSASKSRKSVEPKVLPRSISATRIYKHVWSLSDGKSVGIFPPLMNYPPNHSIVTHPSLRSCLYYKVTYSCVPDMSTDMRDGRDAQVILEAVRLNILPLIKRRLLASERDEIQSGHIYVWEEAQDDGGLLRWTDGRRW